MRHPRDYTVHEAWIFFRLSPLPLRIAGEGAFDVMAVMDAASCYMMGSEFIPSGVVELPETVVEKLVEAGRAQANKLPREFIVSSEIGSAQIERFAEQSGTPVERVPDEELAAFLSEARESFREFMGRDGGT